MKADKFFGALIIIAFVLIGLVYAQFMQQGQMTGKNIQMFEEKLDNFERTITKMGLEVKGTDEVIKSIDAEVRSAAQERKDVISRAEALAKDIEALQNEVKDLKAAKEVSVSITPAIETERKSVFISEPSPKIIEEPASAPEGGVDF